jgi:hypothetical protein
MKVRLLTLPLAMLCLTLTLSVTAQISAESKPDQKSEQNEDTLEIGVLTVSPAEQAVNDQELLKIIQKQTQLVVANGELADYEHPEKALALTSSLRCTEGNKDVAFSKFSVSSKANADDSFSATYKEVEFKCFKSYLDQEGSVYGWACQQTSDATSELIVVTSKAVFFGNEEEKNGNKYLVPKYLAVNVFSFRKDLEKKAVVEGSLVRAACYTPVVLK